MSDPSALPDLSALGDAQRVVHDWCVSTYGAQTLERRGLVLGEEVGEVQRAILKRAEGVRPSDRGSLDEELPQLLIALLVTADVAGVDLSSRVRREFAKLRARTVERDAVKPA